MLTALQCESQRSVYVVNSSDWTLAHLHIHRSLASLKSIHYSVFNKTNPGQHKHLLKKPHTSVEYWRKYYDDRIMSIEDVGKRMKKDTKLRLHEAASQWNLVEQNINKVE